MPDFGRTWWGQRFIAALERFTDPARLSRGRSYANGGRILSYQIDGGTVSAKVRGSINPYFGVYKEPIYTTKVALKPISATNWTKVVAELSSRAAPVTKLLLSEMPDDIDDTFGRLGLHLLPAGQRDFTTDCSCPDWSNPCKHVAGLCYVLASALDQDPFLLFELRGLPRDQLRAELEKSPLGQLLASDFDQPEVEPLPASSYYTRPIAEPAPTAVSYKEFWTGARRLPTQIEASPVPSVPALLIKKEGDYPPFWPKGQSFIAVMEELYERVRAKSPQMK
jgi:uncharacterized Zn finger protein